MSTFHITLEKSLERGREPNSQPIGPVVVRWMGTQLGPVAVSGIGEVGKSPGQHFSWLVKVVKKKNVKMPSRSNKLIVSVQELVGNWTCKCTWYQRSGSTRSDLNWTTHSGSYLHYRQRVLYVPEESYDESCTMIQLPVGGLRLLIMWRRRILSRFEVEEILPSVVCKWECRRQTGAGAYHSCIRAKAGYPPHPPRPTSTPEWVA